MADETGPMVAVWFNQPWLARQLGEGTALLLHGKLRHRNQFWVTEHELIGAAVQAGVHTLGLVPVYPASQGITPERLRSAGLGGLRPHPRRGRAAARPRCAPPSGSPSARPRSPPSHFPDRAGGPRGRRATGSRSRSSSCSSSRSRARKRARAERARARELPATGELVEPWLGVAAVRRRPATSDKAIERIDRDLASSHADAAPADGGGRVAARRSSRCTRCCARSRAARQAAFMAPTETLAEQHMATLDRLLGGHVPLALLTGVDARARGGSELLDRLASGELGLIVGTHALIEPTVEFRALGLVVVDEQHRFGVRQRAALDAKGAGRARAARAPHDGHADPAHARAHRLRRPRRDDPARAAGRPPPGRDARGGRRPRARAGRTSASARRSRRGASASSSARWSRSRRRCRRRPPPRRPSGSRPPSSATSAWS